MSTSSNTIPLLDLNPEIELLRPELNAAIDAVIRSTQFIQGPAVKDFEAKAAAYLGVKHAVSLNSGTDALVIALRALGIGEGDEVITTSFTFFATAEAISTLGATPVFVDIDPETLNFDTKLIEAKITPRTKALLPVHIFGHAVDMAQVTALAQRHKLKIVEDVAQAFSGEWQGKKLGALGDVGCYSFFPSKNLGAFGDGGMLTTDRDDLADTARMLAVHGSRKKYHNEVVGYNSRLDALQAAILAVKLRRLDEFTDGRRRAAMRYQEMLGGLRGLRTPKERAGCKHAYHQYTVVLEGGRRDDVQRRMKEAGIETFVYYPIPMHKLKVYAHLNLSLPETEKAAASVLSLPIWPHIKGETQERVASTLKGILG